MMAPPPFNREELLDTIRLAVRQEMDLYPIKFVSVDIYQAEKSIHDEEKERLNKRIDSLQGVLTKILWTACTPLIIAVAVVLIKAAVSISIPIGE